MLDKRSHRCLVFAHRGASTEVFENTRGAFDKALTYAIDGIETDVQLSRDGVAVLWHDWFLDRAGLSGKRIGDLDFDQLRSIELPQVSPSVAQEDGVFTLEAFVRSYHKQCQLLLEVKNHPRDQGTGRHQASMRAYCDIVERYTASVADSTIYLSSFHLESLIYTNHYAHLQPLIFNSEEVHCAADAQRILEDCSFLSGLCLPIAALDESVVETVRGYNKKIATYTCNTDEEITKALSLRVDILITDDSPKALALRSPD